MSVQKKAFLLIVLSVSLPDFIWSNPIRWLQWPYISNSLGFWKALPWLKDLTGSSFSWIRLMMLAIVAAGQKWPLCLTSRISTGFFLLLEALKGVYLSILWNWNSFSSKTQGGLLKNCFLGSSINGLSLVLFTTSKLPTHCQKTSGLVFYQAFEIFKCFPVR